MAIKSFYVVLGMPRDATPRGIRNAYLRLAKQSHPDRLGESGKEAFQDIQDTPRKGATTIEAWMTTSGG
jgi:molecular chaperone DnaJ